jgi:hypothetical protein
VLSGYDYYNSGLWQEPQTKKEDVAVENSMSPSKKVLSAGQAGKFADVIIARLEKSDLAHKPTQWVLENEGSSIAEVIEAEIRRRVEARIRATEPHILQRKAFDPKKFIGKGWSVDEQVSHRPSGGNLDAGQITPKDYLKSGETFINGEERLKRIRAAGEEDLQLDGEDCLALYEEEGQLTLRWLHDTRGITWLSCWGIILRDPDGDRVVLDLIRRGDGSWHWRYVCVDDDNWGATDPSGVLASSN